VNSNIYRSYKSVSCLNFFHQECRKDNNEIVWEVRKGFLPNLEEMNERMSEGKIQSLNETFIRTDHHTRKFAFGTPL
jgi:hypothetical protein